MVMRMKGYHGCAHGIMPGPWAIHTTFSRQIYFEELLEAPGRASCVTHLFYDASHRTSVIVSIVRYFSTECNKIYQVFYVLTWSIETNYEYLI